MIYISHHTGALEYGIADEAHNKSVEIKQRGSKRLVQRPLDPGVFFESGVGSINYAFKFDLPPNIGGFEVGHTLRTDVLLAALQNGKLVSAIPPEYGPVFLG